MTTQPEALALADILDRSVSSSRSNQQRRKDNIMKDDEVEDLFAWGWVDLFCAVILALCGIAGIAFVAGYLT